MALNIDWTGVFPPVLVKSSSSCLRLSSGGNVIVEDACWFSAGIGVAGGGGMIVPLKEDIWFLFSLTKVYILLESLENISFVFWVAKDCDGLEREQQEAVPFTIWVGAEEY